MARASEDVSSGAVAAGSEAAGAVVGTVCA